jgi:cytochrome c-type biogenesis protein CcmH/NrfF
LRPRFRRLFVLLVIAAAPLLVAADRAERIRELSPKFMCVCGGCNQVLMNCNHVGCPSREAMLKDLGRQIDSGLDNNSIVAFFVEKYGAAVLSAPPASGFNLTAWLMPFVALGIGALLAITFLRRFRARWAGGPPADVDLSKYQDKVEEELKKFTPDD